MVNAQLQNAERAKQELKKKKTLVVVIFYCSSESVKYKMCNVKDIQNQLVMSDCFELPLNLVIIYL